NNIYAYIVGDEEYLVNGVIKRRRLCYLFKYSLDGWSFLYSKVQTSGTEAFSNDLLAIAVSQTNENEIIFGHTMVKRSTDGGVVFNSASPYNGSGFHADVKDLKYVPGNSNIIFCANDGGISVKDMTNVSTGGWEMRNNGLQIAKIWNFDDSENSRSKILIGEQDVGTRKYNDPGWSKIDGGDGYGTNIEAYSNDVMFWNVNGGFITGKNYDLTGTTISYSTSQQPVLPPYNSSTKPTDSYKTVNHPQTFMPYYTFVGEIFKQKKVEKTSTDTRLDLWELNSDVYKIATQFEGTTIADWKRQFTELGICESNPNYVYAISYGLNSYPTTIDPLDLPSHLFKTTTGFNADDMSVQKWNEVIYPGYPVAVGDNFPVLTGLVVHPSNPNKIWVTYASDDTQYRIWVTSDGGVTWSNEDPNGSLVNLPVNGIVYQKNSNDLLYVATDAGVFYKDAAMIEWVKYGDFPNVRVMELKINYCSGKLRAATFGRGIWEGDILPLSGNDFEKKISENIIWSGNAWAESDIRILSGNTLTITGSLNILADKKIIVERGAKLILDGGEISCFCGGFWQGIEIQGNSSLAQTDDNQGVLEMKNGAIIENATIGVLLGHWKIDQYHPAYGGGILRAEPGCIFRNNTTAVKITAYNQSNTSYIYGCQFITDNNYLGTIPSAFIALTNINGIQIKGNTFTNNNYSTYAYNKRGTGISSTGSKFYVDDYTISGTTYQSKFENLWYGINANNYSSVNTFDIKNSDFKNNYIGVKLGAVNYARIRNNNFEVNTQATANDNSCGVYLQSSSGYGVQNNNFTTTNNGHYGVYVYNTGTTANTIYQNDFTGLQTNIQADSQNKGLVMRCNNFVSTTIADIAITGSVNIKQGSCLTQTSAANNLFSHTGFTSDFWTNPGTSAFNYSYNPSARTTLALYDDTKVFANPCATAYNPDMCMVRIRTSGELLAEINTTSIAVEQLKNNIDGGNTQNLLTIALSDQAPGQIKEQLLAVGPYLSDEVLLAAIQRTGKTPLPDGIVKEIVVPNSPVSKEVMKAIITRNPALPEGIFTEINNVQTGTSARTELEYQIAEYSEQNGTAINELLQYYLLDTTIENGTDSLMAFLQSQNNNELTFQLIQAYLNAGQCTEAQNLLSQIQPETNGEINAIEFFNLLAEICINGDTIYNLSGQQLQTINVVAGSESVVSANAQALLSLVTDSIFTETFTPLIAPDTSKIYGYLYESPACGSNPVVYDTLIITNEDNSMITGLLPIITDINGKFEITQDILYLLDTTQVYSLATKSGYKLQTSEYKPISEWISESPLTLSLSGVNLEWYDLYTSPDSISTVGTAIDLGGNLYVAGRTYNLTTNSDVILIKYSPTGEQLWVTSYNSGRANNDFTDDMALDKEGNCYLSLTSENANVVLLKYNADGQLQWTKNIANTSGLTYGANAVELSSTGDVFVAGNCNNATANTQDIFIAKYSKTGQQRWFKTYNLSDIDGATSMKADNNGNAIITGVSYNNTLPQNPNYITLKYNTNGTLTWSKIFDSGNSDFGQYLTNDNSDNIYVTGVSNDKILTIKYNPSGVQQWATFYNFGSYPNAIDADNDGNIYVGGTTNSNIITLKYDTYGNQQWKQIYNDRYDGFDYCRSITTDDNNNIYVTGRSATIPRNSHFQTNDILLVKYNQEGVVEWTETFRTPENSVNGGNDVVVSENDNVYVTGYSGGQYNSYMATLKYSQCPATANLKSAMFTPEITANNEMIKEIDDNELIQVINFKENKVIVYPNPYTESTRIELITKTDAQVSLEVYTMGGQLIENVYSGYTKEGKYNYTFSAKSKGYSAGTYMLKIMVNDEVNSYWLVEMK
ncbi:MAG: hypothetical protein A2265_06785, partial [Bacteroidetes bacterium RIFOXYA12_FULL_33_9]